MCQLSIGEISEEATYAGIDSAILTTLTLRSGTSGSKDNKFSSKYKNFINFIIGAVLQASGKYSFESVNTSKNTIEISTDFKGIDIVSPSSGSRSFIVRPSTDYQVFHSSFRTPLVAR